MPATRRRPRGGAPASERELRERGQRTLARLHAAGVEVFQRLGYQAARVDDIVKAARTSHGTFYLYFANKEDLFRTLALDVATEARSLADTLGPITPDAAGYEELRSWIERFSDLYQRHRAVIQTWTEADTAEGDIGRLGTNLLSGFSRTLARRIAENGSSDLDPDVAAMALVAMIERFNYYFLVIGQVASSREEMLDTLATVAHQGVFGGTASAAAAGAAAAAASAAAAAAAKAGPARKPARAVARG
jgi:AcrR family transcriptional regulator